MNTETKPILTALSNIFSIALVVCITITLPVYLFFRGLPWAWALALFSGFVTVSILGFSLGRRLK